ncbi:MAG: hypothetical protein RRA94_13295, partial [Bacteroidota bacterium]|nr:hypothetical protein [Bacteroidota bacterium]
PSTFDHAQTAFPLTGAHAAQSCESCHVGGNYTITYVDCWQCHETDYNATQNPDHAAGQFAHDCMTCHDMNAWVPATFDHAQTAFPLQGAHAAQPCQACHIGGNYTITYVDCWQCHETDYNATQNPDHAAGQFAHDCMTCHDMNAWVPATFDHAQTAFPLQGAHAAQPCQACHIGGNYTITYVDCWQCHETDYNQSVNPAHAANQFPHDCTTCHDMNAWAPSTFDHAATAFPLTGAHQTRPCIDCHTGGNYSLVYTDCFQCHQGDYQTAASPPHAANQFPRDCTTCHTTTAWRPSTFDHSATAFPIIGAHSTAACLDCHVGGNYALVYTDCYQCHQSDYTQATSPANHAAMNLNHNCAVCHTQNSWTPASPFRTTHNVNAPSGFPIYGSAKHEYQDEWNNCSECHTTNVTSTYCCTSCHEHNDKIEVDDDHQGVTGYSYNCTSCANSGCHPDGREP